jgi:hypothetical protein
MVSDDDRSSFKKSNPTASGTNQYTRPTVSPGPFNKSAHISLDVPKDIPLSVVILGVLGKVLTSFHDGTAEKDHFDFIF